MSLKPHIPHPATEKCPVCKYHFMSPFEEKAFGKCGPCYSDEMFGTAKCAHGTRMPGHCENCDMEDAGRYRDLKAAANKFLDWFEEKQPRDVSFKRFNEIYHEIRKACGR